MIESLVQSLLQYLCTYHFYFMILDEYTYLICDFGMSRVLTHVMLTLAEMVTFKMCKFSVITIMDEYFLTHFITLFIVI